MLRTPGMPTIDDPRVQTGYKAFEKMDGGIGVHEIKWLETKEYITFFTRTGSPKREKKRANKTRGIGKTRIEAVQKWLEHTGSARLRMAKANLETIQFQFDSAIALLQELEQEEQNADVD